MWSPRPVLMACVAGSLVAAPSLAGPTPSFFELTALDADGGDLFGAAVALDLGLDYGVLGAPGDDGQGIDAGAAYVFDLMTQTQLAKLLPPAGSDYVGFGSAVAMNGQRILIGAPGTDYGDARGLDAGAAYIVNTGALGVLPLALRPGDTVIGPRDEYGFAVAVDSVELFGVVGAPGDDGTDDLRPNQGAAYLVNLGGNPAVLKYVGTDTAPGDLFGSAVGISGFTVVVGAPFDGTVQGGVYLFSRSDDPVVQLSKITSPDPNVGEQFGLSLAIEGTTLVVGAPGNSFNGSFSGAAYVYDISDRTDPLLTAVLRPSDPSSFAFFGESVSLSGGRVVVGAPFDSDGGTESGSVYVFDTLTGAQLAKLRACGADDGDNFGVSVGIDGVRLLVGAQGDDAATTDAGAATVFLDVDDPFEDCDGNGEPDVCEIADDPGLDCDGDGTLDICQITADPSIDCDGNLVIDDCEIAGNPSLDCWGGGMAPDFLGPDGVLDRCQIIAGLVEDCNGNFVPDVCEIADGSASDCNNNGVPDECDIDDGLDTDCNNDNVPDSCQLADDPATYDCNSNGLFDACEILLDPSLDCNGDFIIDACQAGDPLLDCDANGQLDECEIDANPLLDCDFNGVLDFCDIRDGNAEDCNGNERLDVCDIALNPSFFDCNDNDAVDSCEIDDAGGTGGVGGPLDMNFNGVLDECESPPCAPDLNTDGVLDFTDIQIFIFAFQICDPIGDWNDDGVCDVTDISLFINEFNAGCP